MKCRECGHELSYDAMFCDKCEKTVSFSGDKVKCIKCSHEMDNNLGYCPRYGRYNSSII